MLPTTSTLIAAAPCVAMLPLAPGSSPVAATSPFAASAFARRRTLALMVAMKPWRSSPSDALA